MLNRLLTAACVAVFVIAPVAQRRKKFVKQIAVGGVDLDYLESRRKAPACRVGERNRIMLPFCELMYT